MYIEEELGVNKGGSVAIAGMLVFHDFRLCIVLHFFETVSPMCGFRSLHCLGKSTWVCEGLNDGSALAVRCY